MVSPMPSASSAPNATADFTVPWKAGPASVTSASGWSWLPSATGESAVTRRPEYLKPVYDSPYPNGNSGVTLFWSYQR